MRENPLSPSSSCFPPTSSWNIFLENGITKERKENFVWIFSNKIKKKKMWSRLSDFICFADFQVEFARRDAGRRVEEDDGDVQVRGDGRETLVSRADQKGQDGGGGWVGLPELNSAEN